MTQVGKGRIREEVEKKIIFDVGSSPHAQDMTFAPRFQSLLNVHEPVLHPQPDFRIGAHIRAVQKVGQRELDLVVRIASAVCVLVQPGHERVDCVGEEL